MDGIVLTEQMKLEFVNFDTLRHKAAKLPKEVYLYIPRGIELIEFDEKNPTKTLRRIFEGGVDYNYYEKTKLIELKKEIEKNNSYLKKKKIILPEYWKDFHSLRFLQATGYNISKTLEIISSHIEWRKVNLPPKVTDTVMLILNSGFIYIHGRDCRFRPIMHIVASVYDRNKKKFSFADWELAVIFFMEYTINNLLLPGQVENWNIITDLNGISITSIPEDLKKILSILQNNYRCRLFEMYIINVGGWVSFGWAIIKKFMDPSTERKIKLLKSTNLHEIFAFINKCQIETKYGGTAEDIESYFFPPIFPSSQYFLEHDKKNLLLLEEEIYKNYLKNNKELIPSPYVNFTNPESKAITVTNTLELNKDEKEFEINHDSAYKQLGNNCSSISSNINNNSDDKSNYHHVVELNISNHLQYLPNNKYFSFGANEIKTDTLAEIEEIEVERNKKESARRITKHTFNQNEKILNMKNLSKNTENCPMSLKNSFISDHRKTMHSLPKSLNSQNPTESQTKSVNHYNPNEHFIQYNEDTNNLNEKHNLEYLRREDFTIREDGASNRVCCNEQITQHCLIM